MPPECTPTQLCFEGLGRRAVVGQFDGGRLTTDGGVLLLREVDRRFRVTERLAGCFRDHRSASRIEHRLETLVAQRVLGLAAGYEDLNDHDRLRTDSVLALASGCRDATDDPLHGRQEGRFYHGYYGHYCYLPLYLTCGDFVLCARLRPANIDAAAGSLAELQRVVAQIRAAWPAIRILVRGDAGFGRDDRMTWCEAAGLDFVFGLARNARLQSWLATALRKSRRRCAATGQASRRFRERRYRTRKSWSRTRRVVGKAEWLPGLRGENPRFVVTNLPRNQIGKQALYEQVYCGRGDMENRIKGAPGELVTAQLVQVQREGEGQPPLPPRVMGRGPRGPGSSVDRGASRRGE